MNPKSQFRIIDHESLLSDLGLKTIEELRDMYPKWLGESLSRDRQIKEEKWSSMIAVGSENFVTKIHEKLGVENNNRKVIGDGSDFSLKEPTSDYSNLLNSFLWNLEKKKEVLPVNAHFDAKMVL